MAKRGGKAANRRAKQRKAHRPNVASRPAQPIAPADDAALAAGAQPEPMRAPATASASPAREPSRRVTRDPRQMVAGPSRLGERAQQEYHYVTRDLRNIGVLVVVMVALLAVAFVVFNVMGITRAA